MIEGRTGCVIGDDDEEEEEEDGDGLQGRNKYRGSLMLLPGCSGLKVFRQEGDVDEGGLCLHHALVQRSERPIGAGKGLSYC